MESTLFQLVRTPMYIYGVMMRNQIVPPKPKRFDLLNVSPPMHPLQQPGVDSQIITQLSRFLPPLVYLSTKDLSPDQYPKEARHGQRKTYQQILCLRPQWTHLITSSSSPLTREHLALYLGVWSLSQAVGMGGSEHFRTTGCLCLLEKPVSFS